MDRKEFLKTLGLGVAAVSLSGACGRDEKSVGAGPVDSREGLGDKVGLLGFGCMRWPMKDDGHGHKVPDQEAVNSMVDEALARGVNYFDSSPVYMDGTSEEAAAKALSRHPRDSYYIATKLSVFRNSTKEKCLRMYRRSFEIYGTDYIDYYLLHSLKSAEDLKTRYIDTGMLDFLREEKAAGRIRHLGFSFHGPQKGLDSLLELQYDWDFVQIQMNYKDWNHAAKGKTDASYAYREIFARGIPVIIMEPLLGGQLSRLPQSAVELLKAAEPDRSVASWAFRFCGSFPGVLTVLSGMSCAEHLEDNLRTFTDLKQLKEQDFMLLEKIAGILDEFPFIGCTDCRYCLPCPYGIDIPGVFAFYNERVRESSFTLNTGQRRYALKRKRFLLSYGRAVESAAMADHCIGCGKCVKACPQHIPIPKEMRRIDDYIEKLKREDIR